MNARYRIARMKDVNDRRLMWATVALVSWGVASAVWAYGSDGKKDERGSKCAVLGGELAEAEQQLAATGPELRDRMEQIEREVAVLSQREGRESGGEVEQQKEQLLSERGKLEKQLKYLEAAVLSWQAAVDACVSEENLIRQREEFRGSEVARATVISESEATAMQAKVEQLRAMEAADREAADVRSGRMKELEEAISGADSGPDALLVAELAALRAEDGSSRQKAEACQAELALLHEKLAVAGGGPVASPIPQEDREAAVGDVADAANKERLARQLQSEARDRLGHVQKQLASVEEELKRAAEGLPRATLSCRLELLRRVEAYEQRRLSEAELKSRAGQEKRAMAQLRDRVSAATSSLEQLGKGQDKLATEARKERAEQYRSDAQAALAEAEKLDTKAEAAVQQIAPWQKLLPSIDAMEEAISQRLLEEHDPTFDAVLYDHVLAMTAQLDVERQQIDLMVATIENIAFAIKSQALLHRKLAGLHQQCADALDPPVPSFWQRQRKIVNSLKIVVGAILLTYALKLLVWLVENTLAGLQRSVSSVSFSVKRASTLISFAGSIVKLFIWVAAIVMLLNEFGVDPKQSGGAIGLIGLILAGMFQQIVIDFVKGLDIVAGRHFDVGDFIHVDGCYGHVVDFNVKHTRLRTLSGQQVNIPNSRCIPSRRFPDGYVDNYVDLVVKSAGDKSKAIRVLESVSNDLNQRIEAVREEPQLSRSFQAGQGRVTLRYLVRVLPGCDWVVRDYFVPVAKERLAEAGVELSGEPSSFFINRIETFRKLFSRELTEEEIIREASSAPPLSEGVSDGESSQVGTAV